MIEFTSIPVSSEMKAFREPRLQGIEVSTQCVIHEVRPVSPSNLIEGYARFKRSSILSGAYQHAERL